MEDLTIKQKMIYDFYVDYLLQYQKTPPLKSITDKFRFLSKWVAIRYINELIKKGYLYKIKDDFGCENVAIVDFSYTKKIKPYELTEAEINLCDLTDDEFKQKYIAA